VFISADLLAIDASSLRTNLVALALATVRATTYASAAGADIAFAATWIVQTLHTSILNTVSVLRIHLLAIALVTASNVFWRRNAVNTSEEEDETQRGSYAHDGVSHFCVTSAWYVEFQDC
jgi:uncharacterized membrane protein